MSIDPQVRLESANLVLEERRLGRLYSVEEGIKEGPVVEGVIPIPLLDRAASAVMVIARRFGKKIENFMVTMHRGGLDHIACCILAYFRHPVTGKIWFVTLRQKRLSFYFDALSMLGVDDQKPTKGWTDEFTRGYSDPQLVETPTEYQGCADHLEVVGLQPWMPPDAAQDVRALAARELGGVLRQPGIRSQRLEYYARFNENSGGSAVFVHCFLLELTLDDLTLLEGKFGGRAGKLSFHSYEEIVDEARRDRYNFAFGQEAHSLAALWKLEHSSHGARLGLLTSLQTHS